MRPPEQIVDGALAVGNRLSPKYRRGLDALRFRLKGLRIECPCQEGTAQVAADFAGNARGHAEWRALTAEPGSQ